MEVLQPLVPLGNSGTVPRGQRARIPPGQFLGGASGFWDSLGI